MGNNIPRELHLSSPLSTHVVSRECWGYHGNAINLDAAAFLAWAKWGKGRHGHSQRNTNDNLHAWCSPAQCHLYVGAHVQQRGSFVMHIANKEAGGGRHLLLVAPPRCIYASCMLHGTQRQSPPDSLCFRTHYGPQNWAVPQPPINRSCFGGRQTIVEGDHGVFLAQGLLPVDPMKSYCLKRSMALRSCLWQWNHECTSWVRITMHG